MRESRLLELIDSVYEAALEPGRWKDAMGAITHELDGAAGGVRIQNGPHVSQFWTGLEPDFERAYLEHYALQDPWVPAALARPAGRCYTSQELVPDDVLERSEFYNELCKPFGMRELCGGLLERSGEMITSMSVMRRDGSPPFDSGTARALEALTPHVRRALSVQHRLRTADGTAAWSAVDALPIAVAVVDRSGRIHRLNSLAERLLAERDGLESRGGCVRARDPVSDRKLAELVLELASPLGTATPSAPVLSIRRSEGKRPLAVVAARVTRASAPKWELHHGGEPEVLLAIASDSQAVAPPARLLRELYGLTPAEARVAVQVGLGKSPREVSDELGIAWNTVRFQLRQAFEKMNVRRQSELTRVLLSLGCLPNRE